MVYVFIVFADVFVVLVVVVFVILVMLMRLTTLVGLMLFAVVLFTVDCRVGNIICG